MILYFIRIIDDKKVKVGITNQWEKRLRNIQTGGGYRPNKMIYKIFDVDNAIHLEKILKINFKEFNIIGEWFHDIEIVNFFYDKVFNYKTLNKELIYNTLREFDLKSVTITKSNDKTLYIPERYSFTCYLKELTEQQKYTIFIASEGELHLYNDNIFYKVRNEYYSWYYKDSMITIEYFLRDNNIDYRHMDLEEGEIVALSVKRYRPMKRLNSD